MRGLTAWVFLLCAFSAQSAVMTFDTGSVGPNDQIWSVQGFSEDGLYMTVRDGDCVDLSYPDPCAEIFEDTALIGGDALNPYDAPWNNNGSTTFHWASTGLFQYPQSDAYILISADQNINLSSINFALSGGATGSDGLGTSVMKVSGYATFTDFVSGMKAVELDLSPGINWSTHSFDSDWNNLEYVKIQSWAGDVAIDNISANIVPVPAAVWLFGSGLGLLGWIRRRKTA